MSRIATDSGSDAHGIDTDRVRIVTLPVGSQGAGTVAYIDRRGERLTRAFDLCVAIVLMLAMSPIFLSVAVLVRFTSPGPVIFRQIRTGQHGKPFTLYKFRTMVDGADALLDEHIRTSAAFRERRKLDNDPRVTRVGAWLRRTSIDELPQLYNVLRGDMSIVGPRPVPPDELAQYYRQYADRILSVKPGLTGLWQVEGRSSVSYDARVALDLEYLQRRSLRYDLLLVLRTIPAVLTMRGAV